MEKTKNILVAPLNWGLGHATRSIPIIRALESKGFIPIIASDGVALQLLKKEFPHLQHLTLPSYNVTYAKSGKNFRWKIFSQAPSILKAIGAEKKIVAKWLTQYNIKGIISDNRLGVYSNKVPSVFITHQLNVLTGSTSWLTTKLHHYYIKKFNECWVPDVEKKPNLTGRLGHLDMPFTSINYIGPLSRLHKKIIPIKYELMIILSGPEPQRTLLEEKLKKEINNYNRPTLFIQGIVEDEQKITKKGSVTFYNFMNSNEIETAFNESEYILCRSGYTTVMDLAKLGKKAFFIPTPGQYEQEYLAEKYKQEKIAPSCSQEDFTLDMLQELENYNGLQNFCAKKSWCNLFSLF